MVSKRASSMLKLVFIFIFIFIPSLAAVFGDSKPESRPNQRKLASEKEIVSLSIDCGADDDSFIETGVKQNMFSGFVFAGNLGEKFKTVRSFPNGTRNCYTLTPANAKRNQKYLITAYFFYGNYDNQNYIPSFDLHVGVNKWIDVNFKRLNPNQYYALEIIYVSDTEYADVCLVNTGSGVPFISFLELHVLDDSMYIIETGSSLVKEFRYDIGAVGSYIDEYGRYWDDTKFVDWLLSNTTGKIASSDDSSNTNSVPDKVWTNAALSSNASMFLEFNSTYYDKSSHQLHIYFYFAEIFRFEIDQQREMTVTLGDGSETSVTLDQYLTPVTTGPLNMSVTSYVEFSIKSVVGAHLPPIVNGFEIFKLNMLPYHPTDSGDVAAMKDIKKLFQVTKNWQGDPCIPTELSWHGVTCSKDDNPPRIISLELRSSNLTGELPESLSNLTALTYLDFSYNELTGSLPASLAQLKYLTDLVLSGNNLTGPVPPELTKKFKDELEKLRLNGNPLCKTYACNKRTPTNNFSLPLIIAVVIFSILVLILSLTIFLRRRKRQKRGSLEPKDRAVSYSQIVSITSNFKTVIGKGGFGMVYHGVLSDQTQVAVKLLSKSSSQGSKEFRAEAQLLMIIHHRNLVSLVGYCDENGNMGLIYEYMANGNLQQLLSETNDNILNWRERLQIAVSSAQGLEYLHNGCKPPIIHRDLKPANILLDEKMQAKISDFGLSKAFSNESMSFTETTPAGTLGYLDPEYQSSGNLNKKSDVYSFGIILLEIITGQRAIIRDSENCTHIVHWVNPIIREGDIGSIVDPRLHGEFNSNAAWKVVEVAMSCVETAAIRRPDMNDVLVELKEALEIETRHLRSRRMRSTDYSMEPVELSEGMAPQAR